jgi:hypothetical protein
MVRSYLSASLAAAVIAAVVSVTNVACALASADTQSSWVAPATFLRS